MAEDRKIMLKLYFNKDAKKKEPREITSSTYIRAQNRLQKEIDSFLNIKK